MTSHPKGDEKSLDTPDRFMIQNKMARSPISVQADLTTIDDHSVLPADHDPLPDAKDIENDLRQIVQKSAKAKAAYNVKLSKFTYGMKDSNKTVRTLQEELKVATKERDGHQMVLDKIKRGRERENHNLQTRKLHLNIVQLIVDNPISKEHFLRGLSHDISFDFVPSPSVDDLTHKKLLELMHDKLIQSQLLTKSADVEKFAAGERLSRQATEEFIMYKQKC